MNIGFSWVGLDLVAFDWVLLGFTGFYWVLLGFTGFGKDVRVSDAWRPRSPSDCWVAERPGCPRTGNKRNRRKQSKKNIKKELATVKLATPHSMALAIDERQ